MKFVTVLLAAVSLSAAVAASPALAAAVVIKGPDVGPHWQPLSSEGTYVYADSFVAPITGTVDSLGVWLAGGSSNYQLEVLGDTGGDGPDGGSILAQTGTQQTSSEDLTYVNLATTSSGTLIAGQTYWFAASTVGLGGYGGYVVGGHTQNSGGISDNGTFWYSNDPAGLSFDGQGIQPEIAFTVSMQPLAAAVPEAATWAMMMVGLGVVGGALRRRQKVSARVAFA